MTTKETLSDTPSPETKERILASALVVFGEKGYHNATMAEIAEEANLGKGTLYWYFSSKEDLFSGMIEQGIQTLAHKLQSIMGDETLSYSRLLSDFIKEFLYFSHNHRQLARIFLSGVQGLSNEFRERMHKWHIQFIKVNADLIRRGLKEGFFRPDIEMERVVTAFTGVISAFANRRFLADAGDEIEAETVFICNLLTDGIGIKDEEGDKF